MESNEVSVELLKHSGKLDKYLQITGVDTEAKSQIMQRLRDFDNPVVIRMFSDERIGLCLLSGTDRVRSGIISELFDDEGDSPSTPRKEKDLAIMREKKLKPEEVLWAFPFEKDEDELSVPRNSAIAVYDRDQLEALNPPVFFRFKGEPSQALLFVVGRKPLELTK